MAHKIIPIRFKFLRLPVRWTLITDPKTGKVLSGQIQKGDSPGHVAGEEIDAWKLRDDFFRLPESDVEGLRQFLDSVGVWSLDPDSASREMSRYPLFVHPEDVWRFREDLKDVLLHRRLLIEHLVPTRSNNFPLSFEVSADGVAGIVRTSNARRMLIATAFGDVIRRIRFKRCKLWDCKRQPIFQIETEHERLFCSPECAHHFSVRKIRARKRARKGRRTP